MFGDLPDDSKSSAVALTSTSAEIEDSTLRFLLNCKSRSALFNLSRASTLIRCHSFLASSTTFLNVSKAHASTKGPAILLIFP